MRQEWQPEAVVFVGLQGSGKSTFYLQRFFRTHVRINLDMLKTRHRETLLLRACIEMQQHFVVDNTNLRLAERTKYIDAARSGGFRITGYFFLTDVCSSIARNKRRSDSERVPVKGILGAAKRLEPPRLAEGFDTLYSVRIDAFSQFITAPWDASG